VPSVEFFGGIAITVGLLTVLAAMALVILLVVAMATDGYKRIQADVPIDALDDVDHWLYLSEVTYLMLLTIFIAAHCIGVNEVERAKGLGQSRRLLLALSGHAIHACECLLLG
jgi:hypothetical protein